MKNQYFNILTSIIIVFALGFAACQNDSSEESPNYPFQLTKISDKQAADLSAKIRQSVAAEVADGLELELWASDTLVNDPIAISVDETGKIYYSMGTRLESSEFDIRAHRNWMTASISFQSVEDRRAFIRKTFAEPNEEGERFLKDLNGDSLLDWRDLTVEKEQVWVVSDSSEDGLADHAQLYIEDFHEEITDLANGIEYFNGEVFLSVGPDLWRLKDTDGDGIANTKKSISHGYTVHVAFGAHGMSGVTVGPQGRIWWGTGDIGMNVVDQTGKRWKFPNQGTVVRSDPDGSNFEVYAAGVRNTHEFTFDEYGNLISEDNDGDHPGERERLVYLINGSDSGWRINWQFGKYTDPDNNTYKVWMDERMSVPRWDGQAAYFLPPIQNYVNGPTGLVYNPGTALSEEWYNHFFIAEFRGSPANSPLHAFTLKPKGASFEMSETKIITKGILPTGLDFGPEGALYVADWIDGWNVKNEGRIWKIDVTEGADDALRKEVKNLLDDDYSAKSDSDLAELLAHQDMRIRKKAQFELVERGTAGAKILLSAVEQKEHQLARVHGMWGLAQMARTKDMKHAASMIPFLKDEDSEIVTQAAKMLGDVRYTEAAADIIPLLSHPSLRVQLHATEALGRMEHKAALQPILDMLEENNDEDAWLRHAGMIALGRLGEAEPLAALSTSKSKALRTAAVVGLRRMASPLVAEFLKDEDEYIVAEAARAINDDYSIPEALPALANVLAETAFTSEALIRRSINAALRVGEAEQLQLLVDYSQNKSAPEAMRAEAIAALSTWAKPSPLDRVDGRYRGEVTRDGTLAQNALQAAMLGLLNETDTGIQIAAIGAISRLKIPQMENELFDMLRSSNASDVKTAVLNTMNDLKVSVLDEALEVAINDKDGEVRSTALQILPNSSLDEKQAVELFQKVINTGSSVEQQAALASLGTFKGEAAVGVLTQYMDRLISGSAQAEIQLDIIEAVESQGDSSLLPKLAAYYEAKPKDSKLAEFSETLAGGNPRNGGQIYFRNEAAQCTRCHAIFEMGGNVGPGLSGLAERLSKEEILESLVDPSATLAKGYGIVALEMKNGETISGIVEEETDTFLTIKTGSEDIKKIPKVEIDKRQDSPSAMPAMGTLLSKKDIRDLVAFLSQLKEEDA